ncbi:hypothetical protein KG007_10755 [Alistipes sp. kh20]|uniref:hypothetical protein n=1 Tax=Alistipes montrealensis TaxID=2834113 RepID=UPI001BCA6CB9|nr:hypothetical protein [Alistipes montrealensis]MBS4766683.1 hypothetical protein [Alistipes montrealensis]
MKSLKIFFLATVAIAAGLFTACNDDDFTAGPDVDGAQVYFPENVTTQHSISDDVTSIAIPVKRIVKDEALTVAILASDESELFTIPSSVTFAAGKETSELLITFDRTKLEDGKEYPLSFLINDEDNSTPYGNRMLSITVAPWPWEELGTGKFRDDWLCAMFKGGNPEIEVTVHKHKSKAGIYMIEEMYGWPFLTEFFGADQETVEAQAVTYTPANITIDCSDPNKVFFPRQFTGVTDIDSSYGDYEIATLSGGEGTLVNGVITFPKEALGLLCKAGNSKANKNGLFRIILPGYEAVDYSLAAVYGGMKVGSDNETATAVVDFTYGADVTGISYVFVSDDATDKADEIAAEIVAGTAENIYEVKNFEVGAEKVSIEAELTAPAAYTVVALPKDKSGKLLAGEVSASTFYFPGMAGAVPDNDIAATLIKVSAYPDAADYVSQCPDYSSFVYEVSGTDMKSVKIYINTTYVIENIEIQSGGLTLQEAVRQYGKEFGASEMTELAETGKYWNLSTDLASGTSYTLVVEATNNYGKTKLIQSEPFRVGVPPYTGELAIGKYDMSYVADAENTFENVFEVVPTVGSGTEFFVKDFAMEDDTQWYATYDSGKSTLTLSGVQLGREKDGNLLGAFTEALTADQSLGYGIYSFAGEESKGSDPVVLTVDPASKQVSKLVTDIEVPVADFTAGKIVGAMAAYYADGTVITKNSGTSSASAIKTQSVRTKIPFSSVRVPASVKKSLDSRALLTNTGFVKKSYDTNNGVRTLSVKTAQCEPLPKQIGRRADFKIRENRPILK